MPTYQVRLPGGEVVERKRAEGGRQLSNRMWEICKLCEQGHPRSILTTNLAAGLATVATG